MADLWVDACAVDEIDEEDVIRFDHGERTYAIYRSPEDTFHATDGLCTHERAHLADGPLEQVARDGIRARGVDVDVSVPAHLDRPRLAGQVAVQAPAQMGEDEGDLGEAVREGKKIQREARRAAAVAQNDGARGRRELEDLRPVVLDRVAVKVGVDLDADAAGRFQELGGLVIRRGPGGVDDGPLEETRIPADLGGELGVGRQRVPPELGEETPERRDEGEFHPGQLRPAEDFFRPSRIEAVDDVELRAPVSP